MNYYFFGYRDWSLSVFSSLKSLFPNLSLHHCKDSSRIILLTLIQTLTFSYLSVGVTWFLVNLSLVSNVFVFIPPCLYRVVAPFKIKSSVVNILAVTLFKMDLDVTLVLSSFLSNLEGFLDEVLDRISSALHV